MKQFIFITFSFLIVLTSCDVSGVKKKKTDEVISDTLTEISKEKDMNLVADVDTSNVKRTTKTLLSGVKIVWTEKHDSLPRLKEGDVIRIKQIGRLKTGQIFESWKEIGRAPSICLGYKMAVEGWEQGLYEMAVGEKAKISVPSKLAYGKQGFGAIIPPNSDLIYEVEIVENIQPIVLEGGVEVYNLERAKNSKANIDLKDKEISFGYASFVKGKGMYDNSYKSGSVFKYTFGKPTVVPGLNIAMPEIRIKDKSYVKIPAKLAYGKKGLTDFVPPNSDILYDIMLVDIK